MSIIGDIKPVAGGVQKIGNNKIYQKMIAIQEQIIEILKEENLRLNKAADISSRLEFRDDVYWLASEEPGERGPYCPRCQDAKVKLIHLILGELEPQFMNCPECHLSRRNLRNW